MMNENAQVNKYSAECISRPLPLTSRHSTRYPNQGPLPPVLKWGSFNEKEDSWPQPQALPTPEM